KRVGPIITPLKILQRGDWFGELSIISDSNTHLASVKAISDDMETVEIPKEAFRTFISNNPEVSFRIFDVLVTYISQDQSLGDEYEIG
ncbi:cyclic nucleotide-binding domain-containing protein, partial [bacterium]|nr:cyclic nucleotide-binding domain-containing protein [bacterium]